MNEPFEPSTTPYDWLSRDAVEVQRYVDDPLCGFERMSTRPTAASPTAEPDDSTVPAALPLLIVNGADDPIGGHELLNETNRDEVTTDLLEWLLARAG